MLLVAVASFYRAVDLPRSSFTR